MEKIKFDDPIVKKEMIAVRYRVEQELTANEAIKNCNQTNLVLELYAGTGGLTNLYSKYFKNIITNDLNKDSDAKHHYSAMKFLENINEILPSLTKIDLIDFDCYGCPALEIQKYFEKRGKLDVPFVLRFSDGLGLFLKRNKNENVIRKRYLIEGVIPMERVWLRHPQLIDYFMQTMASRYGMKATKIISVQTKFKNYTLGAYKFTNQ